MSWGMMAGRLGWKLGSASRDLLVLEQQEEKTRRARGHAPRGGGENPKPASGSALRVKGRVFSRSEAAAADEEEDEEGPKLRPLAVRGSFHFQHVSRVFDNDGNNLRRCCGMKSDYHF